MTEQKAKRILITGSAGGMGRVCAELAAAEGYQLVLADLGRTRGAKFAEQLANDGVVAEFHALDVADPGAIAALAKRVYDTGGIDAIIHTVGISPQMADGEKIMHIDLVASIQFLEAVRPSLNPGGCAVCISSSSAYMATLDKEMEQLLCKPLGPDFMAQLKAHPSKPLDNPGMAYTYAKKGLQFYVADSAFGWGQEGKRLVSLSPGLIDTEMGRGEYKESLSFQKMKARLPLTRLGLPEEIANTALFLVSAKASYISGCDILVDGGLIAGMGMAH